MLDLKQLVRTLPDYPQPGVMFRDITTLLYDARGLRDTVERLAEPYRNAAVGQVAGIEARGFIIGGAVALELGAGFVPVRKPGKLPGETIGEDYQLEYGNDRVEVHTGQLRCGERVLLIDDLIATGGTALAAASLLERAGAELVGCAFVIDLPDLNGASLLRERGLGVHTLISFDGN